MNWKSIKFNVRKTVQNSLSCPHFRAFLTGIWKNGYISIELRPSQDVYDATLINNILEMVRTNFNDTNSALVSAHDESVRNEIADLIHYLYGSVTMFDATQLKSLLIDLEIAIRLGSFNEAGILLDAAITANIGADSWKTHLLELIDGRLMS